MPKFKLLALLLTFLWSTSLVTFAEESMLVGLEDGSELEVKTFTADGESLLIILPSEHGITEGLINLAKSLAQQGVETWLADPFSTWFLPEEESSLAKIDSSAYVQLISKAIKTRKRIYLMSNDKGAPLLLNAARQWQASNTIGEAPDKTKFISGVMLISPNLYAKTPLPGEKGDFLPITANSNLPIFIFIPAKSTLALRSSNTFIKLASGGSDVFLRSLANVRNRFFFRADATSVEMAMAANFAKEIRQGMRLVASYAKPRKFKESTQANVEPYRKDQKTNKKTTGSLRQYYGDFRPDDFTLQTPQGQPHSLSDYLGNVVVVNYWASWCPPCVHEMPSMSQLYDELNQQKFSMLAINLGETPQEIQQFLNLHPVSFPVLLDPKQDLTKKWQVFAFPTSYLLDKHGKVRYSVAGGIDWQSAQVKQAINKLLSEE